LFLLTPVKNEVKLESEPETFYQRKNADKGFRQGFCPPWGSVYNIYYQKKNYNNLLNKNSYLRLTSVLSFIEIKEVVSGALKKKAPCGEIHTFPPGNTALPVTINK
jgi:hypothetical protein